MFTIMIAARNSAKTIERALHSCYDECNEIILIDDHCMDDTVARAKRTGWKKLRVIEAYEPGGIPIARQSGLDAVQTPLAAWLDADDEWLPGRADRFTNKLLHGYDVVTDSLDLHDGLSKQFLRKLEVPSFLKHESIPIRLFERNYLPGDTQVGFRTDVFRAAGGYDPKIFGPESYDLLLRAITKGATFAYLSDSGYRMNAYPNSVSRDLTRIRASTALALKKHSYEKVRNLCLDAGYTARVTAWVLVSMAVFREEYDTALKFLDQASPVDADPLQILEPDGPIPLPDGWRRAFFRGSLLLLLGWNDQTAAIELANAVALSPEAEAFNNLGVAKLRIGRLSEALQLFTIALKCFPNYIDAKKNLATREGYITTHPIRRQLSRFEY